MLFTNTNDGETNEQLLARFADRFKGFVTLLDPAFSDADAVALLVGGTGFTNPTGGWTVSGLDGGLFTNSNVAGDVTGHAC